jgi:hypothetical protein
MIKKYLPTISLFVALFLFFGLLKTNVALAQTSTPPEPETDSITLTAVPPRLGDDNSLSIKPGERIQTSIKVRNNSDKAFTVNTIIDDFILDKDGETPVAINIDVDYRWSLRDWIVLAPEFQNLQPKQTGVINVIINVPENALPGGHYAMITHKPVGLGAHGLEAQEEASSIIAQRVGTLVYVIVEGPITQEAYVRDFTFPKFTEYGPVPFSFSVDNQSDIHIKPEISIEIRNLFGRKIDTIQLDSKNVFPMMSRGFGGEWDKVWGMGFYRARLIMSYGTDAGVTIVNTNFWLLPITLVMSVFIVLITTLVIFIAIRRHFLHRNSDDKQRMKDLEEKISQLEGERLEKFDN